MADVGDDLLDGDLDETGFGELDGEEEDALLADDDYDSYQNSRQAVFSNSSQQGGEQSEMFRMVDQVQDVAEGDEIIEDGEEDVLELAVVDELDENELDNGQGNNQVWSEASSRSAEADNSRRDSSLAVPSSTSNMETLGGESDEEESDGRGSRFKTERTTVISLKGVSSGKPLSDIPDSLDNVKTTISTTMRPRGGMQQRGKGNVRGRLGPFQRGGMMMIRRGGFPMRRPNMMPPPHQQQQLHPRHKIHVNPHFRGGMHQPHSEWDERLPPPPGCESFTHPSGPHQEGSWGGPPLHHMGMRPPYSHNMPGPPPQFQTTPQMYHPPQQTQGYEDQYHHPPMETPSQNTTNRIVQFSENSQLITVENQHFQRTPYDQNFAPGNNQFQSPQNVPPNFNNVFPNQFGNSNLRPNFQPQAFPNAPQNVGGYPPHEFHQPQNAAQFQNYDNQGNWNQPHQVVDQQAPGYSQSLPPPVFPSPQPTSPRFQPPFNNQNRFRPPHQTQFSGGMRGTGVKRLLPKQVSNNTVIPAKLARFEHNKQKTPPANIRSNLQEIKTVDNLPDTTTAQEPEPEIEEDEETKQYRLKIAEQKALREKVLKEKEARRLASIIEKQKKQEHQITTVVKNQVPPQQQPQPKPQPKLQPKLQGLQAGRGAGRGRITSANRMIPRQPQKVLNQTPSPGTPIVQIQQMLGTMYKIVKVRTKEGAIVTRKTPLVLDPANATITPMRTVTTAGQSQRRIVLNAPGQTTLRMANNMGRGGSVRPLVGRGRANAIRMVTPTNHQGRTLFTVQTIPQANMPKPAQRVVIDKRPPNPALKAAVTAPTLPVSTLVTIDNLSLSTSQVHIQKLAKQVGSLCSFKHEPELKRATLKFQKATDAQQFYHKFHRKMIDLSRISVTIVPE